MKPIRRISISLSAIILVICCGALLLFNRSATGWKALTVATGSMRPTLPIGSLVLMHRVPLNTLKAGDVITYTNLNKAHTTITHRIVKSYKLDGKIPAFITKGDANQTADQPVVGGLVLGKTVWYAPHLGAWLNQTKKPYIMLPIVYIPALFIVIEEIRRLNEYYKSQIPYKVVGYDRPKEPKSAGLQLLSKVVTTLKMSLAIVIVASFVAVPVHALLKSNTISLVNNRLKVAPRPTQCSTNNANTNVNISGSGTNNSNNVNVNNTNTQNSSTGNATSNSGTATSGNASNTNCTNINITISNSHY